MPFCPVCRSEYRSGFSRCSDCGAELVDRLPEDPHQAPAREELLATRDPDLLPAVIAALTAAGIPHWTAGDESAGIYAGGIDVRVFVPADRLEEARALLEAEAEPAGELPPELAEED